jgi:hypothetical protein
MSNQVVDKRNMVNEEIRKAKSITFRLGQNYDCEPGCNFRSFKGSDRVCYDCFTDCQSDIIARKKRLELLTDLSEEIRKINNIESHDMQGWNCVPMCMFQSYAGNTRKCYCCYLKSDHVVKYD